MLRVFRGTLTSLLAGISILAASHAQAADWYVAPDGAPANSGAIDSPWDITSALNGSHFVGPGDTIWVRGGTYKKAWPTAEDPMGYGFVVKLAGAAGAPVQLRPFTGEHVKIDGGLNVEAPSSHLWIWDFEVLVSEPRKVVPPDPTYSNLGRPWGGVTVLSGPDVKLINLVIHDNCSGISMWTPATESEVYGCLIYNNGWMGTDGVGNGPGIYTQNGETSYKTISDNVIAGNYLNCGLKAYSSKAFVNNYVIEGNIVYQHKQFLVGGEGPSKNLFVRDNYLYGPVMDIGYKYYYGSNVNCTVTNNVIGNNWLNIYRFQSVESHGNLVVPQYFPRPKSATVRFPVNKYDSNRANLVIYNWRRQSSISFNPGAFLQMGQSYRLMDPKNIYGAPIRSGVYNGYSISVPTPSEFAAFVLMK